MSNLTNYNDLDELKAFYIDAKQHLDDISPHATEYFLVSIGDMFNHKYFIFPNLRGFKDDLKKAMQGWEDDNKLSRKVFLPHILESKESVEQKLSNRLKKSIKNIERKVHASIDDCAVRPFINLSPKFHTHNALKEKAHVVSCVSFLNLEDAQKFQEKLMPELTIFSFGFGKESSIEIYPPIQSSNEHYCDID